MLAMRKSSQFFIFLGALITLFVLSFADLALRAEAASDRRELMRRQVRTLDLTDLSLFTEARYIRHLSQADRHTAFQDHPMSLEHFPSGSMILPPVSLRP